MAVTISSEWLVERNLHPMQSPVGTPSKFYFSFSESEWLPISKMDISHAISARNFLIDVLVNCQLMSWANAQLKINNLGGYENLVFAGLLNIQLGLTHHISNVRRQKGEKYFSEQSGKGYEVKWHYHTANHAEGMTSQQKKDFKRAMATRFIVEEAIRLKNPSNEDNKQGKTGNSGSTC